MNANYFCTWHLMYWFPENGSVPNLQTRDVLCDELLFGEDGIAVRHYPEVRSGLYLLLDDGWDVRSSQGSTLPEEVWFKPYIGSCQLSEEKFPGYGETPPERLKTLSEKVKALGWRGLGIWISPTVSPHPDVEGHGSRFADFFRTRMEWSKHAGVSYWKVDWGDYDMSDKHRKLLSKLKAEIYPELVMEHAYNRKAYHPKGAETRFGLAIHRHRLAYSDVLRLYDVAFALSIPTTLSRVAALLTHPVKIKPGCLGLINAEDELYLSAALGLAFGVMRFDIGDAAINSEPNWAFGGEGDFPATRPARRQHDEVLRAVRWQTEFAPAFRADLGNTTISHEQGEDRWRFTPDETWEKALHQSEEPFMQSAPLVVARNVAAPQVTACDGAPPYLVACRNPNGALSIAALGRVTPQRSYVAPKADVHWHVGANSGAVGVFGHFKSLTLQFDAPATGKKILAKDLLQDSWTDMTSQVQVQGNAITLDGAWMQALCQNRPGDFSEPGLVLQVGEPENFTPVATPAAKIKRPLFGWLCVAQLNIAGRFKAFGVKLHAKNKQRKHTGYIQ
ncbi:MAG: hypothetical protein FWD06_09440 [Oscillospiraceae bacterium]|nr:hypothetical protein [Oscillospiraceae bacterium]